MISDVGLSVANGVLYGAWWDADETVHINQLNL